MLDDFALGNRAKIVFFFGKGHHRKRSARIGLVIVIARYCQCGYEQENCFFNHVWKIKLEQTPTGFEKFLIGLEFLDKVVEDAVDENAAFGRRIFFGYLEVFVDGNLNGNRWEF